MAIPKSKVRVAITIHKETKDLLDQLLSLHSNLSYSNIIEIALLYYTKAITTQIEESNKGEKN